MTENLYTGYLALLDEITRLLADLTAIEQEKAAAVRRDDLTVLGDCMKREQALGMAMRGLEKKRADILAGLDVGGAPLSGLAEKFPSHLRLEAKQVSEQLQTQFQIYRSAAESARATLECNLHEIEKLLAMEGGAAAANAGYGEAQPAPPRALRTDLRA